MWLIVYSNDHAPLTVRPIYSSSKLRTAQMMIFSLVAMIGLEKCCITSACLQWLCHSGERTVARGPLVTFSRCHFGLVYALTAKNNSVAGKITKTNPFIWPVYYLCISSIVYRLIFILPVNLLKRRARLFVSLYAGFMHGTFYQTHGGKFESVTATPFYDFQYVNRQKTMCHHALCVLIWNPGCSDHFLSIGPCFCPSVNIFRRLLLWSHWASFAQISYGASLGWGKERLLKWLRSVD